MPRDPRPAQQRAVAGNRRQHLLPVEPDVFRQRGRDLGQGDLPDDGLGLLDHVLPARPHH
eukprot:10207571-Alexandrium_andersonii.AAC.1